MVDKRLSEQASDKRIGVGGNTIVLLSKSLKIIVVLIRYCLQCKRTSTKVER